jgi:hypothetical protein
MLIQCTQKLTANIYDQQYRYYVAQLNEICCWKIYQK